MYSGSSLNLPLLKSFPGQGQSNTGFIPAIFSSQPAEIDQRFLHFAEAGQELGPEQGADVRRRETIAPGGPGQGLQKYKGDPLKILGLEEDLLLVKFVQGFLGEDQSAPGQGAAELWAPEGEELGPGFRAAHRVPELRPQLKVDGYSLVGGAGLAAFLVPAIASQVDIFFAFALPGTQTAFFPDILIDNDGIAAWL
jgi:hypothetical protein